LVPTRNRGSVFRILESAVLPVNKTAKNKTGKISNQSFSYRSALICNANC
jgi:hypothetical protein